jgi:hypothetical protein
MPLGTNAMGKRTPLYPFRSASLADKPSLPPLGNLMGVINVLVLNYANYYYYSHDRFWITNCAVKTNSQVPRPPAPLLPLCRNPTEEPASGAVLALAS